MFETQGDISENGFNRYMVECEYIEKPRCQDRFYSFNRYMVECESKNNQSVTVTDTVLIDTWWNVNWRFLYRISSYTWF